MGRLVQAALAGRRVKFPSAETDGVDLFGVLSRRDVAEQEILAIGVGGGGGNGSHETVEVALVRAVEGKISSWAGTVPAELGAAGAVNELSRGWSEEKNKYESWKSHERNEGIV